MPTDRGSEDGFLPHDGYAIELPPDIGLTVMKDPVWTPHGIMERSLWERMVEESDG